MSAVRKSGSLALVGLCALWSLAAGAQGVYRIVGPDGKVTFSDRPPPDAKAAPAPSVAMPAGSSAGGGAALPFELRNVASRFPVTLYTGRDCGPCDGARNMLRSRGIPFSERTVNTDADIAAFLRIAGQPRLPVLTIGGQQLKGFSESEWANYLDAAGYPKTSQLPAAYRNPAPAPLVAVQVTPATAGANEPQAAAPAPAPAPAEPPPSNPAGIRF